MPACLMPQTGFFNTDRVYKFCWPICFCCCTVGRLLLLPGTTSDCQFCMVRNIFTSMKECKLSLNLQVRVNHETVHKVIIFIAYTGSYAYTKILPSSLGATEHKGDYCTVIPYWNQIRAGLKKKPCFSNWIGCCCPCLVINSLSTL